MSRITYEAAIAGRCGAPVHGKCCVLNLRHATACRARPRSVPEAAAAVAFAVLARTSGGDPPPSGGALCAVMDPDLFFPDRDDQAGQEAAKAICAGCQLREKCDSWALAHAVPYGVWGGTTEGDRQAARRHRRRQVAA